MLENFRCFGARQVARLAPLTLLVGENSTGKTSFLALVSAMLVVTGWRSVPDFNSSLYPLGSFSDIIHKRGAKRKGIRSFEAEISDSGVTHLVRFEELESSPYPTMRRISTASGWVEIQEPPAMNHIKIGVQGMEWTYTIENLEQYDASRLLSISLILQDVPNASRRESGPGTWLRLVNGNDPDTSAFAAIAEMEKEINQFMPMQPVSGGPIEGRPLRVYVPERDQEVVTYFDDLRRSDQSAWWTLKNDIEKFATEAGLFNEIRIKPFGGGVMAPFEVQVRKFGNRGKGVWRNWIDVGYGVSQAIQKMAVRVHPNQKTPAAFLLQQPETHLHPSAQAALGSLFCSVTEQKDNEHVRRQLIVETHSDYIIDRVRMNVRDKKTNLKPEDVSILYFERVGADVTIHSLRIDEQGNVLGAPPSYGQFFLEETNRSIGI